MGNPIWQAVRTAPGENKWIVTLCPFGCSASTDFFINQTGTGTVIDKLDIKRQASNIHITVDIGGSSRPDRINLIETNNSSTTGRVSVFANIHDFLGQVDNVNLLIANLGRSGVGGDVAGPVTCLTHSAFSAGDVSDIQITSQGGNLTGNVIIKPYVPASGVILQGPIHVLDFRFGTIGTVAAPVEIRADRVIEDIYGKEIHARIMGTETPVHPGQDPLLTDSFVTGVGYLETNPNFNGSGLFTGEIRAEKLGKPGSNGTVPVLKFRGAMRGHIWLQRLDLLAGTQQGGLAEIRADWDTNEALRGYLGTISLGTLFPLNPGQPPSTLWSGDISLVPDPGTGPHDRRSRTRLSSTRATGTDTHRRVPPRPSVVARSASRRTRCTATTASR